MYYNGGVVTESRLGSEFPGGFTLLGLLHLGEVLDLTGSPFTTLLSSSALPASRVGEPLLSLQPMSQGRQLGRPPLHRVHPVV